MRFSLGIFIFLWLSFFAISCTGDKQDKQASNEVVDVQIFRAPSTLHPIIGNLSTPGQYVLAYTHECLTIFDPETNEPVGHLAESMPAVSEDNKTMTYTIRKEAAWPDGSPITNKDVLFSLKFAICPESSHPYFIQAMVALIENAEAPDDNPRTFIVKCKKAGVQNPYVMGGIPIIDRRFFDPDGVLTKWSYTQIAEQTPDMQADSTLKEWGKVVLSGDYQVKPEFMKGNSGPYQVVEWEQKNYIKLSKKPNYWGKDLKGMVFAQKPSQIIFRPVEDPAAIALQIKQGAFDGATFMPPPVWEKLSKDEAVTKEFEVFSGLKPSSLALFMNCNPRPQDRTIALQDWRVRRAVAHMFSPEAFNEQYYVGKAITVTTPVPFMSEDYHDDLPIRVKSRDSSAYWLDQAGWIDQDGDLVREKMIDGKKVELRAKVVYPAGSTTENLCKEIIAEAKAVGFMIEIETVRSTGSLLYSGNYDMAIAAVQAGLSPYEFQQEWTSEAVKSGTSRSGYSNPKLDSLNALSMATFDLAKRRPLMKKMQEIWYHDQPAVMIISLANFGVARKGLGIKEYSLVPPYLWANNLSSDNGK
jgi:ABC-type transport system substrate-binding protein